MKKIMSFFQSVKDYLGVGRGKVKLNLDTYDYTPGDTITGTVSLSLKKPVEADELIVQVMCNVDVMKTVGKDRDSQIINIFDFKEHLDGKKIYPQGENNPVYKFRVPIPKDVYDKLTPANTVIGAIVKVNRALSGEYMKKNWYVIARLSVKGIDTTDGIKINVT